VNSRETSDEDDELGTGKGISHVISVYYFFCKKSRALGRRGWLTHDRQLRLMCSSASSLSLSTCWTWACPGSDFVFLASGTILLIGGTIIDYWEEVERLMRSNTKDQDLTLGCKPVTNPHN
jgi:hypothetical protein